MAKLRWFGRRVVDLGRGFGDMFLRNNRLLPPILALLALFVFAWVLAGVLIGRTDDQKPVAHRSEIAQTNGARSSNPAAPKIDNPNVDSYAAYRSKDPFRQVIAAAATTPEGTSSAPAEQTTSAPAEQTTSAPAEQTTSAPAEQTTGARGANGDRRAGGDNGGGRDSDGDGLPDRKEAKFGQDPRNPDTDGDGIPDGLDDSNGDGIPDGQQGGAAAGDGTNKAGGGGRGAGGKPGRGGDLLNSGGTLPPP